MSIWSVFSKAIQRLCFYHDISGIGISVYWRKSNFLRIHLEFEMGWFTGDWLLRLKLNKFRRQTFKCRKKTSNEEHISTRSPHRQHQPTHYYQMPWTLSTRIWFAWNCSIILLKWILFEACITEIVLLKLRLQIPFPSYRFNWKLIQNNNRISLIVELLSIHLDFFPRFTVLYSIWIKTYKQIATSRLWNKISTQFVLSLQKWVQF